MNKIFAIFALCMIAMSSATGMYEKYPNLMNFSQKRSIMHVMAQVEAHLKNNGPLDAITRILDEYETEIRNEQIAHDELYERQTAECVDEFNFRTAEVEDADAALKEGEETLSSCQAQQARAKDDLAVTKKQLKEKSAELINVHTTRRRENYAYDTQQGQYAIIHPAIGEALEYLDVIFAGEGSFLQMTRHSNKLLVNFVQVGKAHHMAPILGALAQLASEAEEVIADTELLNKLQGLFTTLRAKYEAENRASIAVEEAAVAKYTADVIRIETIIANLEQQQADLEDEISDLDKCIITQQNIISKATLKKDKNQRLYDDAVAMCHSMDLQYASAKTGRAAELELLAAITVKVEEHFAQLGKGVTARGELDNFDSTYNNASAYDDKEFVAK